jgi:thiol-disulfide isomerase/thioredoxin
MMKIAAASVLALFAAAVSGPAMSSPAPRLQVQTIEALAPLPMPYNEKANAKADVAAARAHAKASHKLLLIDFGGNWCPDCRVLGGVMKQPEMRAFLQRHYQVVTVDVGRFDRNMDIPAHYGFNELKGVPAVFVVDPKTDRLINGKSVIALADARTMTPQAIADWLARWTK